MSRGRAIADGVMMWCSGFFLASMRWPDYEPDFVPNDARFAEGFRGWVILYLLVYGAVHLVLGARWAARKWRSRGLPYVGSAEVPRTR